MMTAMTCGGLVACSGPNRPHGQRQLMTRGDMVAYGGLSARGEVVAYNGPLARVDLMSAPT